MGARPLAGKYEAFFSVMASIMHCYIGPLRPFYSDDGAENSPLVGFLWAYSWKEWNFHFSFPSVLLYSDLPMMGTGPDVAWGLMRPGGADVAGAWAGGIHRFACPSPWPALLGGPN